MSSLAAVVNFFSQIAGVISQAEAEDMSEPAEETMETSPEHCQDAQGLGATKHESPSQLPVNVSRGIRFILDRAEPQGCPAPSSCKIRADIILSEENSQAPTSSGPLAFSQQPSPEHLRSLGIKVRDFAYESTLPAIRPVSCSLPRVLRQRQPSVGPRVTKRSERDWDVQEGPSNSLLSPQSLQGRRGYKKARCLERKATEPLEEPEPSRPRALEGRTLRRLYSFVALSPRKPFPIPNRKFSATPPTSPLTPAPCHVESQESDLVQTPPSPGFPIVVHVEGTGVNPTLRLHSDSQFRRPSVYTKIALDTLPSLGFSSAPSPPQKALPVSLVDSFPEQLEAHASEGPRANPRARKRRGCRTAGTPPSHGYHLRQRPTPTSHALTQSRVSHQTNSTPRSQPRRTHRLRR